MSLACQAYKSIRTICRSIPPALAEPILNALSDLYRCLDGRKKNFVLDNLKVIAPDKDPQQLCKSIYRHFGYFMYEFFQGMKGEYHQEVQLNQTLVDLFGEPDERSNLLLISHAGNWELTLRHLLSRGYNVTTVVMPHSHADVDDFFRELREHPNLETAPLEKGMRACIKAINNKRIVALACERDYTGSGIDMPILDGSHQISFPKGPAWLMLNKKVSTFFVNCTRQSLGKLSVQLEPILIPDELPSDKEAAIHTTSQHIARHIYGFISSNPEQWITFDPMFTPVKKTELAETPQRQDLNLTFKA